MGSPYYHTYYIIMQRFSENKNTFIKIVIENNIIFLRIITKVIKRNVYRILIIMLYTGRRYRIFLFLTKMGSVRETYDKRNTKL